jgi:hypothetical protein
LYHFDETGERTYRQSFLDRVNIEVALDDIAASHSSDPDGLANAIDTAVAAQGRYLTADSVLTLTIPAEPSGVDLAQIAQDIANRHGLWVRLVIGGGHKVHTATYFAPPGR